tara:strand:+ start:321 stop:452 length:132 start_codon:yes stop_codon:yes gene_type:complete
VVHQTQKDEKVEEIPFPVEGGSFKYTLSLVIEGIVLYILYKIG